MIKTIFTIVTMRKTVLIFINQLLAYYVFRLTNMIDSRGEGIRIQID